MNVKFVENLLLCLDFEYYMYSLIKPKNHKWIMNDFYYYFQMVNPWNICSIYELQYFNCPSCVFKISSKQEFIDHVYEIHPDAIDYLIKINDNSLSDINCPWSEIKKEEINEISTYTSSNTHKKSISEENSVDQSLRIDVKTDFLEDNFTEIESEELNDPLNIELEDSNFKCKKCEKIFVSKIQLKKHIEITHQGIKNHECEHCEKIFSLSENLKRHIKIVHEGRKDYRCNDCEKFFANSTNLKTHMKNVHKGQRVVKCHHCEKSFCMSVNLKTHIKTVHEGRKDHIYNYSIRSYNHKCVHCEKLFAYSHDLKRHIKTIHEGRKDYKCKQCGKTFNQSGSLKYHIQYVHGGQKISTVTR